MILLLNRYLLVVLGLLNIFHESSGVITEPFPINQAVLKGTKNAVISCTSSDSATAVAWDFTPVGNSSAKTNIGVGSVFPRYSQSYGSNTSGDYTLNLIILTASQTTAGLYQCSQGTTSLRMAHFIVIDSDPMCSVIPTTPTELSYDQQVTMSSSISYYGFDGSNAIITWSPDGPSTGFTPSVNKTTVANLTTNTSMITTKAGYFSPFPTYGSNTSFQITPTSGMATNIPVYNRTCSPFKSPIPVKYFNPAVNITGAKDKDTVYLGTNITCRADANPPASYSWLDVSYKNTTNSSTISVWHDGEYRCTAWSGAYNTSLSINLTTYKEGLSQRDKIIIGVVVGVGVPVLIAVIVLIYCCVVKKSKENKEKCKDTRRHNDSPPPYSHVGPQRTSNPDVINLQPQYGQGQRQMPVIEKDSDLVYAQIAVDNNPRSRLPLQMKDDEQNNYADIHRA